MDDPALEPTPAIPGLALSPDPDNPGTIGYGPDTPESQPLNQIPTARAGDGIAPDHTKKWPAPGAAEPSEMIPSNGGTSPWPGGLARDPLNLPFIMGGLGHGARAHSPNEYLVIEEGGPTAGLATMEKSFVSILYNLAEI